MRHCLLVPALLLALALVLPSAAGAKGYIAMYTGEYDETWCVQGTIPYITTLWIVAVPGPEGMAAVGFNYDLPDNVTSVTSMTNESIIVTTVGGPVFALQFIDCLTARTWVLKLDLFVTSDEQTAITFTGPITSYPPPTELEREYSNCEEGYPSYPLDALTHLYLNRAPDDPVCGTTGVEPASWGAIKGVLR